MIRILRQQALFIVIATGISIRLATMILPGTEAMPDIERWGNQTLVRGFTGAYGLYDVNLARAIVRAFRSEDPRESFRRLAEEVNWTVQHGPVYGPVSAFLFWLSAGCTHLLKGGLGSRGLLMNACFNLPSILAVLVTAMAASSFLAREKFPARLLAISCLCLSPALLLHSALGYVDSVFTMFGFVSLIFLYQRRYRPAMWCAALCCMTKPQGILFLPVVAVTIFAERDRALYRRAFGQFVLCCSAALLPFLVMGRVSGPIIGSVILAKDVQSWSWRGANLWWIATWLRPAVRGGVAVLKEDVEIFQGATRAHHLVGATGLALFTLFLAILLIRFLRELKQENRTAIFWAAALTIYGYAVLMSSTHENHLYAFFTYSLPVVALGRKPFFGMYAILSVVFGLNMYLFQGLGEGMPAYKDWVKRMMGFDLSVLVAFISVIVLVWLDCHKSWLFGHTRLEQPAP